MTNAVQFVSATSAETEKRHDARTRLREALTEAHGLLRRFIRPHDVDDVRLIVLWAAHTHLIGECDALDHSPRLIVDSTRIGSGKSQVIDWLECLCPKGRTTKQDSALTDANLRRSLVADRQAHIRTTVFLLDEVDKWISGNKELAGVINSGFSWRGRTTFLDSTDAGVNRVEVETFSAVAFAGNAPGLLNDVESRSLTILMAPDPEMAKVRVTRGDWTEGRRIGDDIGAALAELRDEVPDSMSATEGIEFSEGRAADLLAPLLQVAELAGADWGQWMRTRAVAENAKWAARMTELADVLPNRLQVLKDSVTVCEAMDDNEFISSASLVTALHNAILATYNRDKPLIAASFGGYWKGLDIRSHEERIDGKKVRGYRVGDLREAGRKYLP